MSPDVAGLFPVALPRVLGDLRDSELAVIYGSLPEFLSPSLFVEVHSGTVTPPDHVYTSRAIDGREHPLSSV